jgi:hypothetical protein
MARRIRRRPSTRYYRAALMQAYDPESVSEKTGRRFEKVSPLEEVTHISARSARRGEVNDQLGQRRIRGRARGGQRIKMSGQRKEEVRNRM